MRGGRVVIKKNYVIEYEVNGRWCEIGDDLEESSMVNYKKEQTTSKEVFIPFTSHYPWSEALRKKSKEISNPIIRVSEVKFDDSTSSFLESKPLVYLKDWFILDNGIKGIVQQCKD